MTRTFTNLLVRKEAKDVSKMVKSKTNSRFFQLPKMSRTNYHADSSAQLGFRGSTAPAAENNVFLTNADSVQMKEPSVDKTQPQSTLA